MFNNYPYTDFHELNLDWILKLIKQLAHSMSEFEAINKITFDGAWDITKQYPAWCIVNDNGAGYISIQPVPAGVLLTNSDYWRGVVDYTATIADLQNRVVTLEGQMTTINNSTIPAIDTRLDILENRKYIMIGDSYDTDGRGTTGWSAQVASYLGLTANVDYFKSSAPSRGFIGDTSVPGDVTFLALLNALDGTITDKDSITDIVVCGGANDITHAAPAEYNDLCDAIALFIQTAHSKYKNAKVWIGMCGYRFTQTFATYANLLIDAYETGCKNGATYIGGLEYIMHNSGLNYGDDVHPNQAGENSIAQGIVDNLLGCYYGVHYSRTVTLTAAAAWTITTGGAFNMTLNDGQMRLTLDNVLKLKKISTFTLPAQNNFFEEIATFSDIYCWGNDNQNFSTTVPAYVHTTNSTEYPISLTVAVREKKLAIIAVNLSGSAITNCDQITVGRLNLSGDTIMN